MEILNLQLQYDLIPLPFGFYKVHSQSSIPRLEFSLHRLQPNAPDGLKVRNPLFPKHFAVLLSTLDLSLAFSLTSVWFSVLSLMAPWVFIHQIRCLTSEHSLVASE